MKILVTGAAGFIGFHLTTYLLARGDEVVGIDSLNDYYDPALKLGRLAELGIKSTDLTICNTVASKKHPNFTFIKLKLEDKAELDTIFKAHQFDAVCHLAAQAGVRYSISNPLAYLDANLTGFIHILENCRTNQIQNFCFASSSSVYGLNQSYPFKTTDHTDHPISLYAATKKSNEVLAHSYAHLYQIPTTGLRFFTVYGPWGRPDMALFKFTKAGFNNEPIEVYNHGEMLRDFTYIDDIIAGLIKVIDNPATSDAAWNPHNPCPSSSSAPYRIFNIGNQKPVQLIEFINAIEEAIGKPLQKKMMPMQDGDVLSTYADVSDLVNIMGYKPNTDVREGVKRFVTWYKDFYQVK